MQAEQIKQLIKERFGGMARMGRMMKKPCTGQAISQVIDGKRQSPELKKRIAQMLRIAQRDLWSKN